MHVLLVGAGNMSIQYAKILNSLKVDYSVISRGTDSADIFEREIGKKVVTGGLEKSYKKLVTKPSHTIVATTLESLEGNAIFLLENGMKNVLIEKPGSVNAEGLKKIYDKSQEKHCKVFIGYNRRFYSSVTEAEKLIRLDGGLKSFVFEFTERSYQIKKLKKPQFQLNNWFVGNSTHVLDMAFFFGGKPKELSSYVIGDSEWHTNKVIYTGAGVTEKDILFSYHANWESPGNWKLELLTNHNRYIFSPLEELKVQRLGSIETEHVKIDNTLDEEFKPGIYKQVKEFLYNSTRSTRMLSAKDAMEMMDIYSRMRCDS